MCYAARLIKARRIFVVVRKRLIDNEPSWLFDCHLMSTLKQRLRLQIDWRQKKDARFSLIYFFGLFCIYYFHIIMSFHKPYSLNFIRLLRVVIRDLTEISRGGGGVETEGGSQLFETAEKGGVMKNGP